MNSETKNFETNMDSSEYNKMGQNTTTANINTEQESDKSMSDKIN